MRREYFIALLVIVFLLKMHCAVAFNHKAGGAAVKINDETLNDLLTTKVKTGKLIVTQMFP